jgi:hypothetical protein
LISLGRAVRIGSWIYPISCFLILAGCGNIPIAELVPDVVPAATAINEVRQCKPISTAQEMLLASPARRIRRAALDWYTQKQVAALHARFSLQSVTSRMNAAKAGLPPELQAEPVVTELLHSVEASDTRALMDIVPRANLRRDLLAEAEPKSSAPPRNLSEFDFYSFATTIQRVALNTPMSYGMAAQGFADDGQVRFAKAFVTYYSAYVNGNFVDRFGSVLPKPSFSRTVGNTEIAGTVAVLFELLLDAAADTPVWEDKGLYYPGKSKKPPTAVTAGLARVEPLVTQKISNPCGITALKAEAIQYLAQTAGNRASMLGGTVGGSFGGLHVGLGVLGKWSIGDNQTLQALVKTALNKTFERAAEKAAYDVLYWIPYDGPSLPDLIQKYLDSQSHQRIG